MAKGKHTKHFLIRQRAGSSFSLGHEKEGAQQGSEGMIFACKRCRISNIDGKLMSLQMNSKQM